MASDDAAFSLSSSTNPTPLVTPSPAELRIWLLDCGIKLSNFERILDAAESRSAAAPSWQSATGSKGSAPGTLEALSVRLALISALLTAQTDGVALVSAEQQLLGLLLRAALDRLRANLDRLAPQETPPPSGPALPGLGGPARSASD